MRHLITVLHRALLALLVMHTSIATAALHSDQVPAAAHLEPRQEVAVIVLGGGDNIEIVKEASDGRTRLDEGGPSAQLKIKPCPCPDCLARRMAGARPVVDYGYRPKQGHGEVTPPSQDTEHQLRFVPIVEGDVEVAYVRPTEESPRFRRFKHLGKIVLPDLAPGRRPTGERRSERSRSTRWRPKAAGFNTASKIVMVLMTICLSVIVLGACMYIVVSASVFADQM